MTDTFEDLGIAPSLVAGAKEMGWTAPTALQKDAVPVIRRGNNVVLHASSGAGVTGAWALGVLDRITQSDDDVTALVLVPSSSDAAATAEALATIAGAAGIAVRALATGWSTREPRVVIASPADAMNAVRDSSLKLDEMTALVIAGAAAMKIGDEWETAETLVGSLPPGQRVIVTGSLEPWVDDFVERHARKAMTVPPRVLDDSGSGTSASVGFAVVPDRDRSAALAALIPSLDGVEVAVICRNEADATAMADALAARGLPVEAREAAGAVDMGDTRLIVLPAAEADRRTTRARVVSASPPFDAETLAELHSDGGLVVCSPRELDHLRRIAERAGFALTPRPLPRVAGASEVERYRDELRRIAAEESLAPYLALIDPLLDEISPAHVAAAAIFHARSGGDRGSTAAAAGTGAGRPSAPAPDAPVGGPGPQTFVRLFLTGGERDGITPGDIVGAISGETSVPGSAVGRIDVRESHSTVEVPSGAADEIIRALNGRTIKGRSMRVDYDRKERDSGRGGGGRPPTGRGAPRGRSPGRGGPPRGGPSRGGRGGGDRPGRRGPG